MNEKKTDTVVLDNSERQPCEVWTRVMGYCLLYTSDAADE